MTAASRESEDDFWQKLILPEEDRRSLFPGMAVGRERASMVPVAQCGRPAALQEAPRFR